MGLDPIDVVIIIVMLWDAAGDGGIEEGIFGKKE